jgi:hypothetical protein
MRISASGEIAYSPEGKRRRRTVRGQTNAQVREKAPGWPQKPGRRIAQSAALARHLRGPASHGWNAERTN